MIHLNHSGLWEGIGWSNFGQIFSISLNGNYLFYLLEYERVPYVTT